MLDIADATKTGIEHRVAVGWRKFWSLKQLLLNRRISLRRRFKLFDSTVGGCVLWCAESWTPRTDEVAILKTTQNAMLRRILGAKRLPEELYIDWIQRSTHKARQVARTSGARDWPAAHYRSKWSWSGHVARRSANSWLYRVTSWRDSEWTQIALHEGGQRELRPSRRRWMKWEDQVRRFAHQQALGAWMSAAEDKSTWMA